jgi:streptomycin 6-kinase
MAIPLRPLADAAMARWRLTPAAPAFATDDALLCPVMRLGQPLMLKIADPDGDETGAPALLAAMAGRGAVRLLARHGPAIVIERVLPGGPQLPDMALSGQDDDATAILCDLAALWHQILASVPLPGLIPLDQRMSHVFGHGDDIALPAGIRALLLWAEGLARDLTATRAGWTTLHGDLHHMNALHDARRGWLAIDPKGVLGPPVFDHAIALLNPLPHADLILNPARMARQAAIVAERLALPLREVLLWVALQGAMSLAWSLHDGERDLWAGGLQTARDLARRA